MSIAVTADDFGASVAVNEAVERAHREGVLTHASLMVAGAAAADAVQRAHRLPNLRVGLHLVAIEGRAVLKPAEIPDLVDANGCFPNAPLRLGLRYAFARAARAQLAAEIRAQFAAFAATGLTLHHADAHKHMHLHPTVGALLLEIGRGFGLKRIRVPAEPPATLRAAGWRPGVAAHVLHAWCGVLRAQARARGIDPGGAVFGLACSGQMTEARVMALLDHLPPSTSEIYFHPGAQVPDGELAALLSPRVRAALAASGAAAPATAPACRAACKPG